MTLYTWIAALIFISATTFICGYWMGYAQGAEAAFRQTWIETKAMLAVLADSRMFKNEEEKTDG